MQKMLAKPVRDKILADVAQGAKIFSQKFLRKPKLVVVLVGDDPASLIYTQKKGEAATEVGFDHETLRFPENASKAVVAKRIEELNLDSKVDGILIQRPLPKTFNEEEVSYWVRPEKDVDAFHPENVGRLALGLETFLPCTPAGVIELLKYYRIAMEGKVACVIGRSSIVGKPMVQLLLKENATVLHCHSKTKNLASLTQLADILVVAAGQPHLIHANFLKKGCIVVDVGIHRLPDGKVVGDVDSRSVETVASHLTPVPGGVGPMTIAILMRNTLLAAQRRMG